MDTMSADTSSSIPMTPNGSSRDSKSTSFTRSTLNLECYWEEAQRIRQDAPATLKTQDSTFCDDDDREDGDRSLQSIDRDLTALRGNSTSDQQSVTPTSTRCMSVAEAAVVLKHVAMLGAIVKRKRAQLASMSTIASSDEEESAEEPEVMAPLKVPCDCLNHYSDQSDPQPGDPRDSDYLVLESGDASTTNESLPLPVYRLRYQLTGVSYMDDFSARDRHKLRHIARLELTALFNRYTLPLRMGRSPKRRNPPSESKVLGMPLEALWEKDRLRVPEAKCPVFVEEICKFLETNALRDEGILRIPGNSSRLKRLREELDLGYETGKFVWAGRRTNDAATLLKQFLRELPIPLLTHEYLHPFAATEAIDNRRDQIGALNLLILMLPDVHRETLSVLLRQMRRITEYEDINKMGLSNVAMIIAPNLFCQLGKMSRNADNEVKFAAGTSLIVRVMIYYCHVLFVVPNNLIRQLRDLYEAEASQTKKANNVKAVKKVLAQQKKNSLSSPRPVELPSPVVGQVSKNNHYVIKVLSPEFPRISMILEIDSETRVCEVLANFRRKQLGLISPSANKPIAGACVDNIAQALDLSVDETGQRGILSGASDVALTPKTSVSSAAGHCLSVQTSISSLSSPRRFSSPVSSSLIRAINEDFYECDGNIDCRRLREGAIVMEILKENPSTNFYVKKRPFAASFTS